MVKEVTKLKLKFNITKNKNQRKDEIIAKHNDEEINENKDVTLKECPHYHSKKLLELETEVTKDEFNYQIKIIKKKNSL